MFVHKTSELLDQALLRGMINYISYKISFKSWSNHWGNFKRKFLHIDWDIFKKKRQKLSIRT